MLCPHCKVNFHDNWDYQQIRHHGDLKAYMRVAHCPACSRIVIDIGPNTDNWMRIFPNGAGRRMVPVEVPENISRDYSEACQVLELSPKASAALSRRCLQAILHERGYVGRDLAKEIDLLLNEQDASKAIPGSLRSAIDGIRNFGNFSAHPINDQTTLQIINVEPEEAEWCLEIIEEMFDHFYVRPAHIAARKAALDAKLAAAGKPPSR